MKTEIYFRMILLSKSCPGSPRLVFSNPSGAIKWRTMGSKVILAFWGASNMPEDVVCVKCIYRHCGRDWCLSSFPFCSRVCSHGPQREHHMSKVSSFLLVVALRHVKFPTIRNYCRQVSWFDFALSHTILYYETSLDFHMIAVLSSATNARSVGFESFLKRLLRRLNMSKSLAPSIDTLPSINALSLDDNLLPPYIYAMLCYEKLIMHSAHSRPYCCSVWVLQKN